jgi:integrase
VTYQSQFVRALKLFYEKINRKKLIIEQEDGVNIRTIQELLGHRRLKTTKIYLYVSTTEIKRIISPFDRLDLK